MEKKTEQTCWVSKITEVTVAKAEIKLKQWNMMKSKATMTPYTVQLCIAMHDMRRPSPRAMWLMKSV